MGLEDNEALREVQGSRGSLHTGPVAPARDLKGPLSRLGRSDQTVGLRVLKLNRTVGKNGSKVDAAIWLRGENGLVLTGLVRVV